MNFCRDLLFCLFESSIRVVCVYADCKIAASAFAAKDAAAVAFRSVAIRTIESCVKAKLICLFAEYFFIEDVGGKISVTLRRERFT